MRTGPYGLLLVLLATTTPATGSAGTIQGTVRDAVTLGLIEGAPVRALDADSTIVSEVLSGVDGAYALADIPTGNQDFLLISSKGGYAIYYAHVPNPGSSGLNFDVLLDPVSSPPPPGEPDDSEVSGRILDARTFAPVAGATVRMELGGSNFEAQTNAEGRYHLVVSSGAYAVQVEAPGYASIHDVGIQAPPSGLTYDGALSAQVVPVRSGTWGRIKSLYR